MSYRKVFTRQLRSSYNVLLKQLGGLTNEDTLLQPPFRGNSLNWVLGHIITHRNLMLNAMGKPSLWTEPETAMYFTGSEPITGPDSPHLSLEHLLADLHTSQEQILQTFESMSDEELAAPYNDTLSIEARVTSLSWHEAYHTGQTELLRQLAGTDDGVI